MRAFVVDSSVAAKWLPPLNNEPLASEARALLTDWTRGKIELSVPDLLLIEVANVLWKAAWSGRCKPAEARAALKILISYRKGVEYERTVYDFAILLLQALAGRLGGPARTSAPLPPRKTAQVSASGLRIALGAFEISSI